MLLRGGGSCGGKDFRAIFVVCMLAVLSMLPYSQFTTHVLLQYSVAGDLGQSLDRPFVSLPLKSRKDATEHNNNNNNGQSIAEIGEGSWQTHVSEKFAATARTGPVSNTTAASSTSNPTNTTAHSISSRPYFILHVGPPKTASTSIQCGLNQYSGRLAADDQYYFLGRSCPSTPNIMDNGEDPIKPYDFIRALGRNILELNETFLEETRQRFQRHLHQGHHLILSTEHISSKPMMQISSPTVWKRLTEGFQVKIVVAYRHYFEWYPSFYYQSHLGVPFRVLWPPQGGAAVPSLVDCMEDHLNQWSNPDRDETDRLATNMALWMYQMWSQYFDDVDLLDLHQPVDVVEQFVCQMLPSATHTCNYLQELQQKYNGDDEDDDEDNGSYNKTLNTMRRVSSNLFAERIADTAWQHGMIPPSSTRRKPHYAKKIRASLELMDLLGGGEDSEYYRWCPTSVLQDRIYNASLSFLQSLHAMPKAQSRLFASTNWTLAVQQHDALFQKTLAKHKLCDIHTMRVLHNANFTRQVFGKYGLSAWQRRQHVERV